MSKISTIFFLIIFLCSSCYTRYQSRFYNPINNTTHFEIIDDSLIDLYFYIHGFEWRSSYSKNEYEITKNNSSLDFYFNVKNNMDFEINTLNFSVSGIINNDTIKLKQGFIFVDLTGNINVSDSTKNNKLVFTNSGYELKDTMPVTQGFFNYYFPKNRCDYCKTLFKIIYSDLLAVDCEIFLATLSLDCKINGETSILNKDYEIIKKVENRLELGIH